MTRRTLATVILAALATSTVVGLSTPAAAHEDAWLCVGGENQRTPGTYQGICILGLVDVAR